MLPTHPSSSLPQTPELDHYPTPSPSRPTQNRTPFFNIRRTPESQPEPRPRLEPANDIYDTTWPNRSPTPKSKPKHPSTEFILLSQQISPTWSKDLLNNIPICFNAWFNPYTYHRWLFNRQVAKDESEKEMLDNSHQAALEFIWGSLPDGFMDEFVEYTEMEVTGRKVDLYVLVERIGSIIRELQEKYDTYPPTSPSTLRDPSASNIEAQVDSVDKPADEVSDTRQPISHDAEYYASYVPPTRTCPVEELKPYHSPRSDQARIEAAIPDHGWIPPSTQERVTREERDYIRRKQIEEVIGPFILCVPQ